MEITLYPGRDHQWYLRLVAVNGQVILDSEGYSTKSNAMRAARRMQARLLLPTVARIREDRRP